MIPANFMPSSISIWPFWAFTVLSFTVWIFRTFRLLITLQKTPKIVPGQAASGKALVSVLIPAKNEEKNIAECWDSLHAQNYSNLEILVINDNSSDKTESVLKSLGADYINCPPVESGWTGKNSALVHGFKKAKGDWLLFTDADTRHFPGSLSAVMAHAETRNLDFLTLLPRCVTASFFEDLIQPAAMAFLGLWFPMEKVNDPSSPVFFANGQYLLIRRSLYEKIGGHRAVAAEFLEDFALIKQAKKLGARAECAFGTHVYGTRMYDSLKASWRGWRRIFLHAYERRALPLLQNAAGVFLFSFLPFVLWSSVFLRELINGFSNLPLFLAVTGLMFFLYVICFFGHKLIRAKKRFSLLHPFAAVFITLILLDAAGMAFTKKKTVWR